MGNAIRFDTLFVDTIGEIVSAILVKIRFTDHFWLARFHIFNGAFTENPHPGNLVIAASSCHSACFSKIDALPSPTLNAGMFCSPALQKFLVTAVGKF
ncbi:hypothetical protein BOW30_12735 [Solemya velum gill symbiont]|nr:hypothetical protein BOW30_12735 [Solemya velum gill symbiont]